MLGMSEWSGPGSASPRTRAPIVVADYWALPPEEVRRRTKTPEVGLTAREAARRLRLYGPNALQHRGRATALRLLLRQFASPLILILAGAAVVAGAVGDWFDAAVVLVILVGSGLLGFWQEYRASAALEKLRARVRITTTAIRGGAPTPVPSERIVPGDIVHLSAGSLVPADGVVLEAKDFFVTEVALTGEPIPVEKKPGVVAGSARLGERTNCVFMGTSVRSGTASALIVATGRATAFGGIADRLRAKPPETEFERGIRRYGYLLTQVMLIMVIIVFGANVLLARPPIDSLLFSLALAVGLSPELLPAIISITLSEGARAMAARGVIVRRLSAIENLGSMDVLCADKTGTLTLGVMGLDGALDPEGKPSEAVLRLAAVNASLQTGLANALDDAIVARAKYDGIDVSAAFKVDEIPYDFARKRLSIAFRASADAADTIIVSKGALEKIVEICDRVAAGNAEVPFDADRRRAVERRYAEWSAAGYRVLGIATRRVEAKAAYGRSDETAFVFAGFLIFLDPAKSGIAETLKELSGLGVALKVITGDNRLVTAHLAGVIGLPASRIMTGAQLDRLSDAGLWQAVDETDLFAEVDPGQKERIILALKRAGHVVGFLGDGINDAPALHAADVGISVDQAVDVAKEAADFVLVEHDLGVLRRGIEQGRATFANTIKYISITTSANFGNMISMAAASLFLPFLPLLATQILLNNFLSDVPALAIAKDNVDPELVERPRRWDIRAVRRFMIVFGLVSSVFDVLTFAVLLYVFAAGAELFRTGWFVESLLTELAVALVIRTRRRFYRSRPGTLLLASSLVLMAVTVALPYTAAGTFFGFVPPPWPLVAALIGIVALYLATTETAKGLAFRR
jgi:Mg2+-importing ATPase